MVECAQQVGREYEGALEDGDDQQRFGFFGRDGSGQFPRAVRDLGFVEQNLDGFTVHCGSECACGASALSAKLTIRSWPFSGGAARRLRNTTVSPASSFGLGAGAVQ